jgi:hypothetical protein
MDGAGLRSTWERDGDRSDKVDDVDPVSLLAVFERCTEVFESYGHRIGYRGAEGRERMGGGWMCLKSERSHSRVGEYEWIGQVNR